MFKYNTAFKGVFSCDTIPKKKMKNNESIIVNLSKYNEKGTHFIVFMIINKKLHIIDSLNLLKYNKYISRYIKKYNKHVYPSFRIQDYNSEFCGFFCMSFIMYCTSYNVSNYYKKFLKRKLKKNDLISIKIIKSCIKKQ